MKGNSFWPLIFLVATACNPGQQADRIYINAKIWTGDSSNPYATSLAIEDSTILFVGLDYQPFKGAKTQIVNLEGAMVVPGFMDIHTHFLSGGYNLASVNLRSVKSPAEFIQTMASYMLGLRDARWILGGDWDHEAWGGNLPSRQWIDSVSGNHPVFVDRYDGHMALANSLALKLAGIDKNTPSLPGGEIVRNPATGEPTGVLKDEAKNLVYRVIPPPSEQELDEFLDRASQQALSHGVTQIHDMGSFGGWPDLATYRRAYSRGDLKLRVYSFVPINTWARLDSFIKINGRGNDMLRWGGLKGFVDGSLGSTTAWFYEPYLDQPKSTGLQVTDTNLLRTWILEADSAGLQVADHAIGDRANDWILGVYQEAIRRNGKKDRRFRVEHAQHLRQATIPRFHELGVIASMQPYHAIDDGKWAWKRLDSARLKGTYAFRSLLASGAVVGFGSDWTVAPLDPIAGIYAAVTRRTLDDKNPQGWFPEQKITVEQALQCYTAHDAFAGFQEQKLGMLKASMLADFVVLSKDLFSLAPEKIRETEVLRTIVNGKEAYAKKP